jgi:hypothetical protein
MARIVYLAFPTGAVAGGQKMILRHVETLRDLGFEAVCWRGASTTMPAAFPHRAPVEVETPFRPDDILVVPSDAPNAITTIAALPQRSLIFCQNQFSFAAIGFEAVDRYPPDRPPTFIAVGPSVAGLLRRAYPRAAVEIVPCFADERVFRPEANRGGERRPGVVHVPHKRRGEARTIRSLLAKLHPAHADLPWTALENTPEPEVARAFAGSSLFLSLSRFEAIGMTPLEAMACGCICAGFTGIGGRDYATPENGFWVAEDDCIAAADALAQAADLALAGGPALARHLDAGFATAARWSYAAFRPVLEDFWMRHGPEARRQSGPLDQGLGPPR